VLDRSQEEIGRVRRALQGRASGARRERLELQEKILRSMIVAIEASSLPR